MSPRLAVGSLRSLSKSALFGRRKRELWQRDNLLANAPWSAELERTLNRHALTGNLRDLQRLGALCMVRWLPLDPVASVRTALTTIATLDFAPRTLRAEVSARARGAAPFGLAVSR